MTTGRNKRVTILQARPRRPFGSATHGRAFLAHLPEVIEIAWRDGVIVGQTARWHCSGYTAEFVLTKEPQGQICPNCVARAAGGVLVTVWGAAA